MQVSMLNLGFGHFKADTFLARRDYIIADSASAEVFASNSASLRGVWKPGYSCGAMDPAQAKYLSLP